jgi:hypothetical protein
MKIIAAIVKGIETTLNEVQKPESFRKEEAFEKYVRRSSQQTNTRCSNKPTATTRIKKTLYNQRFAPILSSMTKQKRKNFG